MKLGGIVRQRVNESTGCLFSSHDRDHLGRSHRAVATDLWQKIPFVHLLSRMNVLG